jgi:hypothetical protein
LLPQIEDCKSTIESQLWARKFTYRLKKEQQKNRCLTASGFIYGQKPAHQQFKARTYALAKSFSKPQPQPFLISYYKLQPTRFI